MNGLAGILLKADDANRAVGAMTMKSEDELIAAAKDASRMAYCPYSQFRVGAAIRGQSGRINPGCNIENASYGLTLCAERAALSRAIADGETKFTALAVYTPTATPTAPCGACRQVLNEFGPTAQVICVCDGSEVLRMTVADLLPSAFGPNNLEWTGSN